MDALWQDLKYAARMLRKNPGFAAIAILALALGIGANTAIFSVADAFLLKPLPFHDLDRLVMVLELRPHETQDTNSASPAAYADWQAKSQSFERMAAYSWNELNLTGEGVPEKVQGFSVSPNFFDMLQVGPTMGRTFRAEEDQPGREMEALLSYGLWQRRFAGDPHVLGKTVMLDGKSYTVVGVMPKEFDFPKTAQLWVPLVVPEKDRNNYAVRSVLPLARLKPGVRVAQAQAEMRAIATQMGEQYPDSNRGWSVRVIPLRLFVVGDLTQQYTLLLLGAVGFVLLIVCANVANLQFARASARRKEMAVRAALGASRWRIVRQLLSESVLLALAGSVLGLLFAKWAITLILGNMPADVAKWISGWDKIQLDARALLFTILVAVGAGVISGLAPALKTSQPDIESTLREGGRGGSGSLSTHRLRSILVVAQVSLALILMVGAGLMVKGFRALVTVHHSLAPESILTMQMNLPETDRYKTPQQRNAFYRQAVEQLRSVPQVQSAAQLTFPPFSDSFSLRLFAIEGRAEEGEKPSALYESVNREFFQMMKIPLRSGRLIDEHDAQDAPPAVVISENMARTYWPAGDALGHRLRIGPEAPDNPWLTIVGVAGDIKYQWIRSAPEMVLYRPYLQAARSFATIALRVSGDPEGIVDTVRQRVAAVDPDLPLYEVKTLTTVIYESTMGLAYVAVMLGVIGLLGLVLSAVGVYGVMAYAVNERTHEFGIRMALGAAPGNVLRLALRRGVILTGVGFGIGLPVAMGMARLLASIIYGVGAGDVLTLAETCLLLAAVAGVACYVPAHRAARVDPMVALRYE